jgi:hypothetical protein
VQHTGGASGRASDSVRAVIGCTMSSLRCRAGRLEPRGLLGLTPARCGKGTRGSQPSGAIGNGSPVLSGFSQGPSTAWRGRPCPGQFHPAAPGVSPQPASPVEAAPDKLAES